MNFNFNERVLVAMAIKSDIGKVQTLHDGINVPAEVRAKLAEQLDHLRSALAKLQG